MTKRGSTGAAASFTFLNKVCKEIPRHELVHRGRMINGKTTATVIAFWIFVSLGGCSSLASRPRTGPMGVPPGSHRLALVDALAKRNEIVGSPLYQMLIDGGVKDSSIIDNSEGEGIIYCCGQKFSQDTSIVFHISPGLKLQPGDIVELKMGGEPNGSQYGTVNTALAVREAVHALSKQCRWVPKDDHEGTALQLWRRTLYCDWMPPEGWIEIDTVQVHTWFKPPG